MKFTKIVATIGPASSSTTMLTRMAKAGMNVARLNFSHGDYASFRSIIKNIRTVSKKLQSPIAIMQDLQGPKIRLGTLPQGGIALKSGQKATLIAGQKQPSSMIGSNKKKTQIIPVQYSALAHDIHPHDRILLHDGLVELKVIEKQQQQIICQVIKGGTVETHHGLHVPTASLTAAPLTPKDLKDLDFGLSEKVDFVALSFVRSAKDIFHLQKILKKHKSQAKIVAKIERHEAITNLETIVQATDVIMVARGDLGVDMPLEQVPLLQKKIIYMANLYGKPVITATEMLQSMVNYPRATRAEVSDVANAVLDHTDAVMLSNESAVGEYPVEAVETLAKVSMAVEKATMEETPWLHTYHPEQQNHSCKDICASVAMASGQLQAKSIIIMTDAFTEVNALAKHRAHIPIIVITSNPKLEAQLQLVWGVETTIIVPSLQSYTSRSKILQLLKKHHKAEKKYNLVFMGKSFVILTD